MKRNKCTETLYGIVCTEINLVHTIKFKRISERKSEGHLRQFHQKHNFEEISKKSQYFYYKINDLFFIILSIDSQNILLSNLTCIKN